MSPASSPLLGTMLALAAVFLALSVLIQIVQEVYKYLTKSKSRMYTNILVDTLGPWAGQLLRPEILSDLQVRGPLQFRRSRPGGLLLPLDQETLMAGLERTAPAWVRRAQDCLKLEVRLQDGKPQPPSANWLSFLDELGRVEKGSPGYWTAHEIAGFLKVWDHEWAGEQRHPDSAEGSTPPRIGKVAFGGKEELKKNLDAARLLAAFNHRFLSDIEEVRPRVPQLERNFDYAYRRRNLRQTFVIGLVFALVCNLPFERIYQKAHSLSPGDAATIAQQAMEAYDRGMIESTDTAGTPDLERVKTILQNTILDTTRYEGGVNYLVDFREIGRVWHTGFFGVLRFLFGCLITALLVSFGAPFWNNLASALLRIQQGRGQKTKSSTGEAQP